MASKCTCRTGEKPGKGCYSCTNCGTDIHLNLEMVYTKYLLENLLRF